MEPLYEFYCVKLKKKVQEPLAGKTIYRSKTKAGKITERYALRAKCSESGSNLTRFVKKEEFDNVTWVETEVKDSTKK